MSPEDLVLAHRDLRDRLIAAGHFIATGVDGVYGRSAAFESVLAGVDAAAYSLGVGDDPITMYFPPMIPRSTFEAVDYLRNFPQLCGPVFTFEGSVKEHSEMVRRMDEGEDYSSCLVQSEVALTPACCYPVYPSIAGQLGPTDGVYSTMGYCFRHEPSVDPMRLQAFRQREHIRVGTPDQALEWRETWVERIPKLLESIGLEFTSDFANDPFFGRTGKLMSVNQRAQELKIEWLVPVFGEEHPTACVSANYHQNHFGELFGITTEDGAEAHSGCVGFGLERCVVAMFAAHGTDIDAWPESIKQRVWPS
ncbi:MAG: amino acid--[acyl-carrier-protein] ligase [Ilumatobacteraceae bacterium]|nr:amino acid--[acyl-carrier-protein] ligase [Ilumatobacteraceae bacterium]